MMSDARLNHNEGQNSKRLPRHVAIIMDGNGRWAKTRQLPRIMGHRAGVNAAREVIRTCGELGVKYLTLYAFSQENWRRPKTEVQLLMDLLDHFLQAETEQLISEGVCFRVIGLIDALPDRIQKKIQNLIEKTAGGTRLTLVVALNYGSRQEIVDAVNKAIDGALKKTEPHLVTEQEFSKYLYTAGMPDPDLLIRTSGEMRLSNFLLWQCSYSELYISNKYWPDFGREDLIEALGVYMGRERRFGSLSEQTEMRLS